MKLLQKLVEYTAPAECLSCGLEGAVICSGCLGAAVVVKRATCYRCNRLSDGGKTCMSCRPSSKLAGVTVASHYDGVIKTLIQNLKYRNQRAAAAVAAELITPLLDGAKFDVVTAVPTAASRFRSRGYNQAELIGRVVAKQLGLPYSNLLVRLGGVRQVGHGRQERLKQLDGSFVAVRLRLVGGARVLLVDDVLTTGATMAECAKVLKGANAKKVWGAVVAKH